MLLPFYCLRGAFGCVKVNVCGYHLAVRLFTYEITVISTKFLQSLKMLYSIQTEKSTVGSISSHEDQSLVVTSRDGRDPTREPEVRKSALYKDFYIEHKVVAEEAAFNEPHRRLLYI